MAEHTIQGLMNVTMDKVRQMADANTIIGKPIKTEDGTTIIPVSRISVGIGTGGSDFDSKNGSQKDLFGGGSGPASASARWPSWSSRRGWSAPSSCLTRPTASTGR